MYARYLRESAYYTRHHAEEMKKELSLGIDDKTARNLYQERSHYLEILDVCIDISLYFLVLSLRATSQIDQRAHLHVNKDLVGYGRAAMQEILVIRIREFFCAEKDKPDKFRFLRFHNIVHELGGTGYPMPNIETNNAIARIIHRRRFYSAHHQDGKKEYSFTKNRLHALDLIIAIAYIAKVEDSLYGGKLFDPFEILLNEEADDELQILCGVYEIVTGQDYATLNYTEVLKTLANGDQVVNGEYEDTPEFTEYQSNAVKELQRIRAKVNQIVG